MASSFAVAMSLVLVMATGSDRCVQSRDPGVGDVAGWQRLGFDPAVSSHFHVVEYVLDEGDFVAGVEIYSSKTAAWSFKESEWGDEVALHASARSVFLNGFLHMLTFSHGVVLVDMDGKTWRTIPVPTDSCFSGCIHQAQRRLCFLNVNDGDAFKCRSGSLKTMVLMNGH